MHALFTDREFAEAKSRDLLSLLCKGCGSTFYRKKNRVCAALSNRRGRKHVLDFYSISCHNSSVNTKPKPTVLCDECRVVLTGGLKCVARKKHRFCSSACAAKYLNQRKERKYRCGKCNKPANKKTRTGMCRVCLLAERKLCSSKRLVKVIKSDLRATRKGYQSYRSAIQKHARQVYRDSGKPLKCCVCGYDRHVDIAHIRPVSSHAGDTSLGDINAVENLAALCPNHHWEFDKGLLTL